MKNTALKLTLALAVAGWLSTDPAQAGITINPYLDNLTAADSSLAPVGTKVIWIADMDGSGISSNDLAFVGFPSLSDPSDTIDQWSLDADDLVLGVFSLTITGLIDKPINYDPLVLGVPLGADLYLVWYSGLTGSVTGPGLGQEFAVYRDNLGDTGFGPPYIGFDSPPDGGTYDLYREVGWTPPYDGTPILRGVTAIPEPSSSLLVLCGLGILRMLRRRKI